MSMDIALSQGQKMVMSQRMQLAVKILQMNSLDLENYLRDEALANPLIELDAQNEIEDPGLTRLKKLEWLDRMDESNSFKYLLRPKEEQETPLYQKQTGETLEESLLLQLAGFALAPNVLRLARYLIGNLDENGYLHAPKEQIPGEVDCSQSDLDQAVEALHRMDPAGVGAVDLRECLLIQALREEEPDPVLVRLIENHLDHLAKNQLDKLAGELGVSIAQVKSAREALLGLNPKPGNGLGERGAIPYILPDLFVVHFEDGYQVIYNDFNQPKFEISGYYKNLLKQADDETAAYIRDKMTAAENLIASIRQRKATVLGCARAILARQTAFFRNGPGHLIPMTLADLADDLGVHISTVSRAVSGKYLQSQWGVQRMSDFFSRSVSKASEEKSYDMTLAQIKRIIKEEDPLNPLSDLKIAERLLESGIDISRRTVTKYRELSNIPASLGRKRF
ncbi:MAG: RNA polymerase factor sigma-54 [Oscillospiraceae bacterium]|nr:RNA polymerase factor sigma-54 [Oscillospiraceae bacterium]